MKKLLFRSLVVCACVFAFAGAANSQSFTYNSAKTAVKKSGDAAKRDGSNPVMIIVGTAGKAAWGTTKFAAKHLLKPAAKTIFLKMTPAVTKFVIKNSAKHLLPMAVKIAAL
ncbi:MAG TPA: hypothetical protein PLL77_04350 [Pyrinomonadaceae bacterium]|nr:hypothetical protein [Pyrinomonadaceae bacterium]